MSLKNRPRFIFLNIGHAYDHLFMLLYPTVVLTLETEFSQSYGDLLSLSVPGFLAFAVGTIPAGWLGDRWSRSGMIAIFFIGVGVSAIFTGLARTELEIGIGLFFIGLFASIYHPVGISMVVQNQEKVGRLLGINGVWGNMGIAAAAFVAGGLGSWISWEAAFYIPGAISIITGIIYIWVSRSWQLNEKIAGPKTPNAFKSISLSRESRKTIMLVIGILAVAAFLIGLVFQTSTIALPKLFDEGLSSITSSPLGVGGMVTLVVTVAAFAQIGAGQLIDKFSPKLIWIVALFSQVPLLVLVGIITDIHLVITTFIVLIIIFGEIPIQDALLARNTPEHLRSRVYGIKFSLALGASALAVPIVSAFHGTSGGFSWLFGLLALCALLVGVLALWLPGRFHNLAKADPTLN